MTQSFKITIPEVMLPKFQVPWPDRAAIAQSLKARVPHQKTTSKLPMLLGAAVVVVVLLILVMGVKRKLSGSPRHAHSAPEEPEGNPEVPTQSEKARVPSDAAA
jgi:flagellar biosynthesis/type III secretory pathway M-ring protein FliF/YscJ